MKKPELIKKFNTLDKGKAIRRSAAAVLIVAVALVGYRWFTGGSNVSYKTLNENDIPQKLSAQILPEYRMLERALACSMDDKVYVMVTRGEKPTSGYEIAIEKMKLIKKDKETTLIVYTKFKDPEIGLASAQAVTYPFKIAETQLKELPDKIELRVQY